MLKFTFTKTGERTGSFTGDQYQVDYTFNLPDGASGKVSYRDFGASIDVEDRVILIKPVLNGITISRYLILEGDTRIGQIKQSSWLGGDVKITLDAGIIFKATRVYKTIWDRLLNSSDYQIQLSSNDRIIKYTFQAGAYFSKGYINQRYRTLNGHVESSIDNVLIPSIGLVLIELMLMRDDES
jgi:hypothetical protein